MVESRSVADQSIVGGCVGATGFGDMWRRGESFTLTPCNILCVSQRARERRRCVEVCVLGASMSAVHEVTGRSTVEGDKHSGGELAEGKSQ